MTELGKAGCDTTDVDEIIRFNDDESGRDDWLTYLTVEQVELHAFLQYFAEIGMVDAVCLIFETNEMFFLISIMVDIHMDEVRVPVFHDAADASVADVESLLVANTQATLLGNFAGAALDDIINSHGKYQVNETIKSNFREKALEFCTCPWFDAKKFYTDANLQAYNLQQVVDILFPRTASQAQMNAFRGEGIYDRKKAILEPSFVCEAMLTRLLPNLKLCCNTP